MTESVEQLHPDLEALVVRVIAERYRVDALLGVGGMGAVFRGQHLGLKRDVAIKVLHPELGHDEDMSKRFDREAHSASRLDHPNCLQVTDFGSTPEGMKFMVMQLLRGTELTALLEQRLSPTRAVELTLQIVRGLEKSAGVYEVAFDRDTAEVAVAYDPAQVGPAQFIAVAHDLGYRASEGPGQGAYTPEVEFPADLDVKQISKDGEAVDLEVFRAPDKVTVFDFHAIWCGPCKKVDRHMLAVLRDNDDVALRKLNVVDWDSGVARKYLAGVPSLPYVIVYGRNGKRIAKIAGLELDELDAAIDRGRR